MSDYICEDRASGIGRREIVVSPLQGNFSIPGGDFVRGVVPVQLAVANCGGTVDRISLPDSGSW